MEVFNINIWCDYCRQNVKLEKKSILPCKDITFDGDHYIVYRGRCPKCRHLTDIITESKIPEDIQLELQNTYTGILREIYRVWEKEAEYHDAVRDLEEARQKLQEAKTRKQIVENGSHHLKKLSLH